MADQNPIQNSQTNDTSASTQGMDLLGDISLNIPEAPSQEAGDNISDLGSILVDKSIDNTQQKAESTIPEAPIASVDSIAAPAENNDPTTIDLGDISIPASEDPIAGPQPGSPTTETENVPSGGMFHTTPETPTELPVSENNTTDLCEVIGSHA